MSQARSASRDQTVAAGNTRYFGKVCAKHPRLGGERWTSSYGCVVCSREKDRRHYALNCDKKRAYHRRWFQENRERALAYAKRYAVEHPAQRRRWQDDNKDRLRELRARWYEANGERMRELKRRWAAANKDKCLAAGKRWRDRNPEKTVRLSAEWYLKNKVLSNEKSRMWAKLNPGLAAAKTRAREAAKLQRTPQWLSAEDKAVMERLYVEAARLTKATGVRHEVDHIVPLRGQTVSGLHVPANLQILTKTQNVKKRNRFSEADLRG